MNEDNSQNPQPVSSPAAAAPAQQPLPAAAPVNAQQATSGVWMGAFEAIGEAFAYIKKNPKPVFVVLGVYALLAVLDLIVYGYTSPLNTEGDTANTFTNFATLIFLLALPVYTLALADKRMISVSEFMKFDLVRYLTLVGVAIVSIVIWVLSAIPLLIPLIWTLPWFLLAEYASVDQKLGVFASLKESKRLAENHKAKVWGIIGAALLLSLITLLAIWIPVVGIVISAFVSILVYGALAILYRWLQRNSGGQTAAAAPVAPAPAAQPPVQG